MPENKPLIITNLGGPLTRRRNGDIDSGLARYETSWGYDPYSKPGNLTWMEQPTSIMTNTGGVIPIIVNSPGAPGTASGNYISVVDSYSSVFQITVTPTSDAVSVIGALSGGIGNYAMSAGVVRYGATSERLFVGHGELIARVDLNGANSSIITQGVSGFNLSRPRPLVEFLGKIYFGNGNNIGEIDSTNTVVDATRLDPALPSNTYVIDLDVTPDGNYLVITTNDALQGFNGFDGNYINETQNRSGMTHKLYWNGIDGSFTAQRKFGGVSAFANISYSDKNYTLGYDLGGTMVLSDTQKILSLPRARAPYPNALISIGNMLSFGTPEYDDSDGKLKMSFFQYGQYDEDKPVGLYRLLNQEATVRNDIMSVPACLSVSNSIYSPSVIAASESGATVNRLGGVGKIYYSTVEAAAQSPLQLLGKLWRFNLNPTGSGSIVAGVYETQTQLFSKKIEVKEFRLYTEPLVGGNDFTIDLIGSGGSVMAGGSQRFIVGTSSVAVGTDMVQFNPAMAPTYALGVRITNASVTGVANWTALKVEIDPASGGK